jgi:hypothetical protein
MNSFLGRSAFGGDDEEGLDVFGANFADIDVWGQASCEQSVSTSETSGTSTARSVTETTQMSRQREAPIAKTDSPPAFTSFVERALDVVAVAPPPPPADFLTPSARSGHKISSSKDVLTSCPQTEYIPRRTSSASEFGSLPFSLCPTSAKSSVRRSVRSMTVKAPVGQDGPSDGRRVAGSSSRLGSRRVSGGGGASISQSDHGSRRSRRSLPASHADVPSSDIAKSDRRQSIAAPRTSARKLRTSVRLPNNKSKAGKDSSTQEGSPTICTIYVGGVRTTVDASERANAKPKCGAASRRIMKVTDQFNDSCAKLEDFFQERLQGPVSAANDAYKVPLAGKGDLSCSGSSRSRTSTRCESSATAKKQGLRGSRNSNKKKLLEELNSSFDIFEDFLMEKDNSHFVVGDTVHAAEHGIAGTRTTTTTLPLAGSTVAITNGRKDPPVRRSETSRTRKSRPDQTRNLTTEMNRSFELFDDFMKKNEAEAGGSSPNHKKDQEEVATPEESRSRTSRRLGNGGGRRNRSASRGGRSQFKPRRNASGDEWQGLSTVVKVDF